MDHTTILTTITLINLNSINTTKKLFISIITLLAECQLNTTNAPS